MSEKLMSQKKYHKLDKKILRKYIKKLVKSGLKFAKDQSVPYVHLGFELFNPVLVNFKERRPYLDLSIVYDGGNDSETSFAVFAVQDVYNDDKYNGITNFTEDEMRIFSYLTTELIDEFTYVEIQDEIDNAMYKLYKKGKIEFECSAEYLMNSLNSRYPLLIGFSIAFTEEEADKLPDDVLEDKNHYWVRFKK